jgi:hypothetical protein
MPLVPLSDRARLALPALTAAPLPTSHGELSALVRRLDEATFPGSRAATDPQHLPNAAADDDPTTGGAFPSLRDAVEWLDARLLQSVAAPTAPSPRWRFYPHSDGPCVLEAIVAGARALADGAVALPVLPRADARAAQASAAVPRAVALRQQQQRQQRWWWRDARPGRASL